MLQQFFSVIIMGTSYHISKNLRQWFAVSKQNKHIKITIWTVHLNNICLVCESLRSQFGDILNIIINQVRPLTKIELWSIVSLIKWTENKIEKFVKNRVDQIGFERIVSYVF